MISREMIIDPHIAGMLILLAYDYSLPLDIHCGETIVAGQNGHCQRSVLRKITVEYEKSNEDYLDAAFVILNLSLKP